MSKSPFLLRSTACLVGIIFLMSGISKAFNFSNFAKLVKVYNILPQDLISELVILLILIEIFVGLIFFIARYQAVAAVIASILLVGFMALAIYAKSNSIEVNCGCFSFFSVPVSSITHFIQNAILLCISISILFFVNDKKLTKN